MKYYIAINGQPKGPFDHHQLLVNGLTATSLVWTEGMSDWAQAQSIAELQELLFGRPDLDSANPDEVTAATPPPFNTPGADAAACNAAPQNPAGAQPNCCNAAGQNNYTYGGPYQQQGGNGQSCPPPQPSVQPGGFCPKTWLVESILVTIFCCLPFGVVGIVKASNVESLWRRGDIYGAETASQSAGFWTKLGFWIGLAINIIGPLLWVLLAVGAGTLEALL